MTCNDSAGDFFAAALHGSIEFYNYICFGLIDIHTAENIYQYKLTFAYADDRHMIISIIERKTKSHYS